MGVVPGRSTWSLDISRMPTRRALTGVAHNIAHHAQSGLSYLHPHLFEACRDAGRRAAELELLQPVPYPNGLPPRKPLQLAVGALQDKFWEILEREQFSRDAVASVHLYLQFPAFGGDGSTCSVRATVVAADGVSYASTVE